MNRIANATAEERRRLTDEFLDSIFDFGDGPVSNEFTEWMRRMKPDLPDDPTDQQIDAWLELAELMRDSGFRDRLREMGRATFGPSSGSGPTPAGEAAGELAAMVTTRVAPLVEAGTAPSSPDAAPVVDELVAAYAAAVGRTDTPEYRRDLRTKLELTVDPRAERYWQLMAVVNGWPPIPTTIHLWVWFIEALAGTAPA